MLGCALMFAPVVRAQMVWGQTRSSEGLVENSYLAETLVSGRRNSVWARVEAAARTSELASPAPAVERAVGMCRRIRSATIGSGGGACCGLRREPR